MTGREKVAIWAGLFALSGLIDAAVVMGVLNLFRMVRGA